MIRRRCWPALLLLLTAAVAVALAGCDRGDTVGVNGKPATRPAATTKRAATSTTTTAPATTQAAETLLNIDGNLVLFPAARLRIDEADDKVVARLFSDDPKHALEENYEGNSFYLQLEIDADDAKDLSGVTVRHRAPGTERDDSPYGIFQGRQYALQPADVTVVFEGAEPVLEVRLEGTFLLFDTSDATTKPRQAKVSGRFPAVVQPRK